MNEEQALAEAQRRWGSEAYVFDRESGELKCDIKRIGRFYVGCPALNHRFPYGNGNTWEEAFNNVKRA